MEHFIGNGARILVADDLAREAKSEPAPVLRLASDLAEAVHSEIHLMHAYDFPNLTLPGEAMSLVETPYVDAMSKALDEEVETIRSRRPHLRIVSEVEKGKTVEVILNDILKHNCQLVVLGTHARHGVKRALLGSVAEEVIRRSGVPVLTLNPHTQIPAHYRPSKILVPLDLSKNTQAVLEGAEQFAKAYKSSLLLLTVIEEWVYPVVQSASLLAGGFVMPLERDLRELGNLRDQQLREVVEPLKAKGLDVATRLIERATSVAGTIVDEARTSGCDLVLMGHRHASRLEYAFLGSVSRYVVREAHCPVLTIPPKI